MFIDKDGRENFKDAVEDVLLQLAADGNDAAKFVVHRPLLLRRVTIRVKRQSFWLAERDGSILDAFERLVQFLLEHADEILAVIIKLIPLFLGDSEDE